LPEYAQRDKEKANLSQINVIKLGKDHSMVKLKRRRDAVILILQPNRSANWQQNKMLILAVSVFVMIIAITWSMMGAWLILPFAGLEVSLLAFLLYRTSYSSYQKQIITIGKDVVTFEAGIYYPKCFYRFCKRDMEVKTIEPRTTYEQTQITLEDQKHKVDVGHFLNQQDRTILMSHFRVAQLHIFSDKWWQN
jgi:uncharacterized membrane protein